MSQATDTVWLPVLPTMKGFGPALVKGAGKDATAGGRTLGSTMGKAMVVGLAAAAAGVAAVSAVLYSTGKTFDDVNNTIRVGTGASGDALKELNDVAKNVGRNVPAEWDQIATVVADLNTRLGLSGDTLDTVASQYLEAGRILGEDVNIQRTSAAFTAFGIEGDGVSDAMDHLFRVSQATGVGMNELADSVATNAPAVQQLGFTFEESTALIGNLDKAGLNSSKMMAGLGQSLVRLAKDGEEPRDAFERATGEITSFLDEGDRAGAIDLAGQIFGTRNAPQFIKALEDGTMSMDDLGAVAGMTEDTILQAGQETMQFGEQWQLFKNNVMVWLEPMATRVFGAINDLLESAVQGVISFVDAFQGGGVEGIMGDIGTSARNVFDYLRDVGIPALKDLGSFVTDTAIPALRDFGSWLNDNKATIGIVAGVITVVMLPALVRLGITALVSGAQAVAGWVMQRVAAVQAGVAYVVQSIRIIGTWVAMAAAAVVSGAQTAGIWLMYRLDAIRSAGVYVAQRAVIIGSWIAMAAAAVASGARTALVWAVQVAGAAATGAVRFLASAGRVVGGWVLMSVQSALHAARMAAAWFVALGPIGWVTAAVIAIAALVIANWDKISAWTKKAWSAVMAFIVGAWQSIRTRTLEILTAVVSWVVGKFVGLRDRTREIWGSFKDAIVGAWRSVHGFISDFWQNKIRPILSAFGNFIKDTVVGRVEKGVGLLKSGWEKVANIFRKPINWVINSVWNGGIAKAFNAVADKVGIKTRIKDIKEIGAFAKGGRAPTGWALVGEEGPELVDFKTPGRVYTAGQTRGMQQAAGDAETGQHRHPMGGGWVSKIGSGLKSVWDTATGWVRGGFANMAEATFKPLIDRATTKMAEYGRMGEMGGGLIDAGMTNVLDWIRGKDSEDTGDGFEFNGPMQMGSVHRPANGPITSPYGMRGGRLHGGIDFAGPLGSAIYAIRDGIVHSIQNYSGSGHSVNLSHGGGSYSHYGHNAYGGVPVKAGQAVKAGQRIGTIGMTGRTTGPHVHLETWQGGMWNRRNPNALFGVGGARSNGALLRDGGGPIYPGLNMVLNKTPHLERTFNDPQFQNLNKMAELAVGRGDTRRPSLVVNNNGVDFDQSYKLTQDFRRTARQLERSGY